jgi:hypothetical protein
MSNDTCSEHKFSVIAGVCPVPADELGHYPGARRELVTPEGRYIRTLSRTGVWAWKIYRSKGPCIPCQKARASQMG